MKEPRRVYRRWLKRTGAGAGEQSVPFGPRMTRPVKSLSQEDFVDHFIVHSDSIPFGDELSSLERSTVIVRAFHRALGQLGFLARHSCKSLSENSVGSCFRAKGRMARRDERAYPPVVCKRGATQPDGLLRENPPGGGSFACGLHWLSPYSPLRGCAA